MGLVIEYRPLDDLAPYDKNPRTHTADQIRAIERSLAKFGWATPMGFADGVLIYGHARRQAAVNLRKRNIAIPFNEDANLAPVVDLSHLSDDERRAYVIADNQLAQQAGWDEALLGLELQSLQAANFDLSLLGFGDELSDLMGMGQAEAEQPTSLLDIANITLQEPKHQVAAGDHWTLHHRHHLLCCSVIEDWALWRPLLKRGSLFIPYPGPFAPHGARAAECDLIMVQPDPYAAGMLLDRYTEAHGEDAVRKA